DLSVAFDEVHTAGHPRHRVAILLAGVGSGGGRGSWRRRRWGRVRRRRGGHHRRRWDGGLFRDRDVDDRYWTGDRGTDRRGPSGKLLGNRVARRRQRGDEE